MKKLKYSSHGWPLDWLKEFYQNNKDYMRVDMVDTLLDAVDCMEYVIAETNNKTKTNIVSTNTNLNVGDTIYIYEPNSNEKYSSLISEITINKFGTTLNDIYAHTICPACNLDSNEKWGPYLYFSSDKKRQEYIDNYNENK